MVETTTRLTRVPWLGSPVVDASGHALGTVRDAYADGSGALRFLGLDVAGSYRVVPAGAISLVTSGLRLPYPANVVQEAPATPPDRDLDLECASRLYEHFGGIAPDAGDGRGFIQDGVEVHFGGELTSSEGADDEVVEIPIYAEELVKRRVLKEVIRVRKRWVTRVGTAEATLRQEEIEVLPDSTAPARGDVVPAGEPGAPAGRNVAPGSSTGLIKVPRPRR